MPFCSQKFAGNLDFFIFFLTKNELKLTSPDSKRLIQVSSEVIEGIFGEEFLVVLQTTKKHSQI